MDITLPEIRAEVGAVFARYEDALVNNRIDVLDVLFWPSEFTVRYGAGENLRGIDAIRAFRAARPSVGLARTLQHTVITTYGRDFATAMTEFTREGQMRTGRQSQTWVRFADGAAGAAGAWAGGWRVVAAHVSLLPA